MIEYYDLKKFVSKKADLYNFINPFFDLNYLKSINFFYLLDALQIYKNYFDNIYINIDKNIKLDNNQRKVILTNSSNLLVIAGAGSGKTTTIAAKIKFMVDILKINPEEIALLSYTNEAVKEMERIIKKGFLINTNIFTFHKFALSLINTKKKIRENYNYEEIKKDYSFKEMLRIKIYLYLYSEITFTNLKNEDNNFIKEFNELIVDLNKYLYEKNQLKNNLRASIFKKIFIYYKKIIEKYNADTFTFDSMIEEAKMLEVYKKHYKYLLIDEYQDISNQRLEFILKYKKSENCKLVCVGDDWQTIYSFASSNINNILNFESYFNDCQILKIVKTYRNSQELIDIAGTFVMKNSKQIKKKLKSNKKLQNPLVFLNYRTKEELIKQLVQEINKIILIKNNSKIAFLLRYKNDLRNIVDDKNFKLKNNQLYFHDKEIFYFTIHTSKGLGFDQVFIINNQKGYYGFPPKRPEKKLFKMENSYYEERRLLYVALTRTKNKIYLLVPRKSSEFIKEIKKILKKNLNML